jgi:membrane protein DedA with SNARE-associated domain
MDLIAGVHGTVGTILLCALLLAEEAGVPLPFFPGEFVLIAAGLLVAAGAMPIWVFIPLASGVCIVGALVAYSWARLIGEPALRGLARKFRAEHHLDRVFARLRSAGPAQVALSRLVPGLRIYTSMVAGVAGVPRSTFLIGVVPAALLWVSVFTILGAVVGRPALQLLDRFQAMAIRGLVLVIVAVAAFWALRRVRLAEHWAVDQLSIGLRRALAAVIDGAVVAAATVGVIAVGRQLLHTSASGWLDVVAALVVVAGLYAFVARQRSARTAAGALKVAGYRLPAEGGLDGGPVGYGEDKPKVNA